MVRDRPARRRQNLTVSVLSTLTAVVLGVAVVLAAFRTKGDNPDTDGGPQNGVAEAERDVDDEAASGEEGSSRSLPVPVGRGESSDRTHGAEPMEDSTESDHPSFKWDELEAVSPGAEDDVPLWEIFLSRRIDGALAVVDPVGLHRAASVEQVFPQPPEDANTGIDPISQRVIEWLTMVQETDVIEIPIVERRREILTAVLRDGRADMGRVQVAYRRNDHADESTGVTHLVLAGSEAVWWDVWIYVDRGEMIDLEYAVVTEDQ